MEAARLAEAHDFISTFVAGYDTLIGSKGVQLSGGQVGYTHVYIEQPYFYNACASLQLSTLALLCCFAFMWYAINRNHSTSALQRQRIALARALLRRKRVRTILLDEATSALDVPTEQKVMKTLIR